MTELVEKSHSSDSKPSDLDVDKPYLINKAMELNIDNMEELCKACIKSKHTRVIKSKRITLTTKWLQEIHINLWGPHKPVSISDKSYIMLLLDEFICKSWIILLRSKDEFFNVFKLWLPRAEICKNKLDCLQTNDKGECISAFLQRFCKKWGIEIGYATPYMHKENKIVEQCWRILV